MIEGGPCVALEGQQNHLYLKLRQRTPLEASNVYFWMASYKNDIDDKALVWYFKYQGITFSFLYLRLSEPTENDYCR